MANFIFEPKKTEIFQIARKENVYNQPLFKFLRVIIWFLGLLDLFIWVINIIGLMVFESYILGFALILISISMALLLIQNFYQFYFNYQPKMLSDEALRAQAVNMADFLSVGAIQIILEGLKIGRGSLTTGNVLLAFLKNDRGLYILARAGINPSQFREIISSQSVDFPKSFNQAVEIATEFAQKEKHAQIEIGDLFYGLSQADSAFQKICTQLNLRPEDIANIVYWERSVYSEWKSRKRFFSAEFLEKTGGVGREWAYGYTPTLSRYSYDISQVVAQAGLGLHIIGHSQEIDETERILSRSGKHNVILIGEPGVGKKTAVLGFIQKIKRDRISRVLRYKHLIQLDLGRILGGDPAVVEQRLVASLNEALSAGNIILFIEDIHSIFGGSETKIGAIDASEVLVPYLQSSNLQLIGTTTFSDFHKYIESNSSLAAHFEKIEVTEPTEINTIRILEDAVPTIEGRNKIMVTYEAIKEVVKLAKRYIFNKPFPEKAIDLLDEVAVFVASNTSDKAITPEHVQKVVSGKTKIPTGEVQAEEKEKLLNLEQVLHQRVIDQNEAISAIAESMRRARAGLKKEEKPIGTFLFLGPTGVGKTETARALAANFFGSEKSMSRLDMSEFKTPQGMDRLIGTAEGGEGVLTSQIKENPYCLLLLDEIEKAHPDVLNLFLQVLDEGRLTDRLGRTVNFSNTIIIATSNAGAELIRQSIKAGEQPEILREKLLEYLQKEGIFRPEFLNRFDGVISFKPLGTQEIYQIAQLMLGRLAKKLKEEKEVDLAVSSEAILKLATLGYNPEMGARPMQRVIADKVENWLAEKILKNEIQKGQKVVFSEKDVV